jgi:hypothetical protein
MGAGNQSAAIDPILWMLAIVLLVCLGGCGLLIVDVVQIFQGAE